MLIQKFRKEYFSGAKRNNYLMPLEMVKLERYSELKKVALIEEKMLVIQLTFLFLHIIMFKVKFCVKENNVYLVDVIFFTYLSISPRA